MDDDKVAHLAGEYGYVQLAEDQRLPSIPAEIVNGWEIHKRYYQQAQQEMLKAGWRKVKQE